MLNIQASHDSYMRFTFTANTNTSAGTSDIIHTDRPTNSQNNGRFEEINHFPSVDRSYWRILLWISIRRFELLQTNSMEFRLMINSMAMNHPIGFDRNEKEMRSELKKAKIYSRQLKVAGYRCRSQHQSHIKTAWNL